MQLILDACTILNLLQVDIEEEEDAISFNYDYFSKIEKLDSFQIIIVKKVYEEIEKNYSKNLKTLAAKGFILTYIKKILYKYIPFHDENRDFTGSLDFLKKASGYQKDNGELHSTAYALYENRYNNTSALSAIFATDDDGAIADFNKFFQVNLLGQIIVTIDILILLFVHDMITKNEVLKFAYNLKRQYIQNYHEFMSYIQQPKAFYETKEIALLTKLRGLMDAMEFTQIPSLIINHSIYKSLVCKDKQLDKLLKNILTQDFTKVKIIDQKIIELKQNLWSIEAA